MRIRKINFQEINFEYCSYPQSMYDSIKRIGLSFPIKVNIINGKYYCKDGHKRLSIIQDLLKNEEFRDVSSHRTTDIENIFKRIELASEIIYGIEEGYEKRRDVPYIIYNDGSSRSNDCWRDRNMH